MPQEPAMQREMEPEGLSPQPGNSPPIAACPRESPKRFATSSVPSPLKGSVEAGWMPLLADFSWKPDIIQTRRWARCFGSPQGHCEPFGCAQDKLREAIPPYPHEIASGLRPSQ